VIAVFSFSLIHLAPGSPIDALLPIDATNPEQVRTALEHEYGLDKSLPMQFWIWSKHAVEGNFGTSIWARQSVMHLVLQRMPTTLELALSALVLATLVGVFLGAISATRPGATDTTVRLGSLLGISIPVFVFGILLVMLFGLYVPGLPYSGWVPLDVNVAANLKHLILPTIALALAPIGLIARQCRSAMLDVLGRDYIQMARAFGVRRSQIIWLDALKNSLLPVLSVLGVIAAALVGGSVVIENIFDIPGLGRLLFDALQHRDYPLVGGIVFILSLLVVFIQLLVDIAYGIVNPRIARSYGAGS
jgi:peptide/nickel transport system permease protein